MLANFGFGVLAAVQDQLVTRLAWPFFAEALDAARAGDAAALTLNADGTYSCKNTSPTAL